MKSESIILKDWRNIDISIGLIYPNVYKIGMSSYAMRLIYNLLNSYKDVVCERFFLPEDIKYPYSIYTTFKNQLRSIENRVLLNDFDILGFSIQFENDYRNVLWILDNAAIPDYPLRQEKMKKENVKYPLIIGGGPVITSNPIPFSKYFDLFFIGDAEPNLDSFLNLFHQYKDNDLSFSDFLKKASQINGIFVPSRNNKVKRAVINDLDQSKIPIFQTMSINSEQNTIFEKNFFIEVNRGCPFQCKFCISSYHNTPFRNRSLENIKMSIDGAIKVLDFKVFSLIGSCAAAHPRFYDICEYILEKEKKFTIPSIRIEYINSKIIKLFESGGLKTITIAPETGSEKLRYKIGKKISNEKIISVVNEIKESRINNIKLYFLIGLPNEEEKDIEETIEFLKTFANMGFNKGSLRVNINIFIPKLNTPYESEINYLLRENLKKIRFIYQKIIRELKNLASIKLKFQNIKELIKNARLQALISLGDNQIGELLPHYYINGANYGALRKVEKIFSFSIDNYFLKISNGYCFWKI